MATVALSGPDLLKAVQQLDPEEFDAFLEKALSLRKHATTARLSAQESRLIRRINRGLPDPLSARYAQLAQKRERKRLTDSEHDELLTLTHESESCDADRAAALLELANLRHVPIRMLMKQMGIKATPPNG